MARRFTNLRLLIPKWRSGQYKLIECPLKEIVPGNYFELEGEIYKIWKVLGTRKVWCWKVNIKERRLSVEFFTVTAKSLNIFHYPKRFCY